MPNPTANSVCVTPVSGCAERRRRAWRATVATLALACAASVLAACGDDDGAGTGGPAVEYHPAGGVSEQMHGERPSARLNLDHTVVTLLEAANGDEGDVGSEHGVDEFHYHFEEPTQIRLSLDRFDEAPELIALDDSGNEIAHVTAESGDAMITMSGHHVLRLVHPHAGDATFTPIPVFLRPILPAVDAEPPAAADAASASAGYAAQVSPTDVATLQASKNCVACNFRGLVWDATYHYSSSISFCSSLDGIDLSHADFTGAKLSCLGIFPDVYMSLLTGTTFDGATLSGVIIWNTDLTDARFSGATFDGVEFAGVLATGADFSDTRWSNSIFGADPLGQTITQLTDSAAPAANFRGAQFTGSSCLAAVNLVDADFAGASFDSTSLVGNQFAGANVFNVTFDGTKFRSEASENNCGLRPPQQPCVECDLGCRTVTTTLVRGCENGCRVCVRNEGAETLSTPAVCQRPTVQEAPRGVTFRNTDLTGVDLTGADLRNSVFASTSLDHTTSFSGANLAGVDFSGEHLGRGVDLSEAFLSDSTNFDGAVLSDFPNSTQGVNLSCVVDGATQTGGCSFPANTTLFKGKSLQYVQLANAGLTELNLQGAILDGANLVGAQLNFTNLKGASLVGAHLGVDPGSTGAATLNGAYMINVDLTDADLRSVDLSAAHVYGATTDALFVRTLLNSADFSNAILADAVFTDAILPGAVFNTAQLVNAKFDGATLTNAKFDNAYLQGADFSTAKSVAGVRLSNAAVSTTLTSQNCTLIPPGSWNYSDQDGIPYTYAFGETQLQTDASVVCPDGRAGPCTSGDSLCPQMSGPFPPVPPCVPSAQYCYENCLDPPCFKDKPNPTTHLCPLTSNCE